MTLSRLLAGCALAAALLASCTDADPPSGGEPTGFDAIASSTTPPATETPAAGNRLIGEFVVTKTVTKVQPRTSESGRVGDAQQRLWDFQPACETGACGGTITSTNPVTTTPVTLEYAWDGTEYTFTATGEGPCGTHDKGGTATFTTHYRITPGEADRAQGTVTSFTGTEVLEYEPADARSGCPGGRVFSDLVGRATD